jgi:hypothetical protein
MMGMDALYFLWAWIRVTCFGNASISRDANETVYLIKK